MRPSVESATVALCRLPIDYHGRQPISELQLLRASGYRENREAITVKELMVCLRSHPAWVEGWIDLSADQRVSEGWYVVREGGRCAVGRIPGGSKTYFDDCVAATAEFVKLWAEDLADWNLRGMLAQTARWFVHEARDEMRRWRQKT
jgi:hypothetical protein